MKNLGEIRCGWTAKPEAEPWQRLCLGDISAY
jgi:hypothetical protein